MKNIDALIATFKEFKDELNKGVNMSYSPGANSSAGGSNIMGKGDGQDMMAMAEKAEKPGHSTFHPEHLHAVMGAPSHADAKGVAHKAVDSSSANPMNKKKMKMMIEGSKSQKHLAQGMSNFMLAHPSEGLKVVKAADEVIEALEKAKKRKFPVPMGVQEAEGIKPKLKLHEPHPVSGNVGIVPAPESEDPSKAKTKKMKLVKSAADEVIEALEKAIDFSGPTARALAAKHPMPAAAPKKDFSGPAARSLAAKHPMPSASAPGAHGLKQNAILDARRANALKAEEETLKTDKNGQWSLDKAQHGINVEDVSERSKEKPIKIMPMKPGAVKAPAQNDENKGKSSVTPS